MPFGVILFLFTLAEVVAIVVTVKTLGFFSTFGLMVLAAMVGGWLLRREGLSTLERFVRQVELQPNFEGDPQSPLQAAWEGMCLVLAAILLIVPGILSDVMAILLLLPFVRVALFRFIEASGWAQGSFVVSSRWIDASASPAADQPTSAASSSVRKADVIDVEWQDTSKP
jgi:UPF0716 protein FxsA